MNILGFASSQDCHDSSAEIVCDGELVGAVEEERLTRRQHEPGLPIHAIEFCLRRAGLRMAQVDVVAVAELPFRTGPCSNHAEMELSFIRRVYAEGKISQRSLVHKIVSDQCLRLGIGFNWQMNLAAARSLGALRELYGDLPPTRFYDHHRAHAAAAYLTSCLDRAAIANSMGTAGSVLVLLGWPWGTYRSNTRRTFL